MLAIEYHLITNDQRLRGLPMVSPTAFIRHVTFARSTLRPVTNTIIERAADSGEPYPDRSFYLTFDDSLAPTVDCVLPILREYELQGCFFVYTEVLGSSRLTALERQRVMQYLSGPYDQFVRRFCETALSIFPTLPCEFFRCGRENYEKVIEGYLAEWSFYTVEERFYRFLRDKHLTPFQYGTIFETMFRETFTRQQEEDLASELYMSERHLRRIWEEGHIVGAHSHTHPFSLTSLDDADLDYELGHSKEVLERAIDREIRFFAYPNGRQDARVVERVRRAKYTCGFATSVDPLMDGDFFRIPRRDGALLDAA